MVRVEYQTKESTGLPYMYCHGCGTVHDEALLIDCMAPNTVPIDRWMRLCGGCVNRIVATVEYKTFKEKHSMTEADR